MNNILANSFLDLELLPVIGICVGIAAVGVIVSLIISAIRKKK